MIPRSASILVEAQAVAGGAPPIAGCSSLPSSFGQLGVDGEIPDLELAEWPIDGISMGSAGGVPAARSKASPAGADRNGGNAQ